jgi:hypothetical protein
VLSAKDNVSTDKHILWLPIFAGPKKIFARKTQVFARKVCEAPVLLPKTNI